MVGRFVIGMLLGFLWWGLWQWWQLQQILEGVDLFDDGRCPSDGQRDSLLSNTVRDTRSV